MNQLRPALVRHARDLIAIALIVAGVVVLTAHWAPRSFWSPDALFYEANVLEFRGAAEDEALEEVWTGPLSAPFRADDAARAPGEQLLADGQWVPYTSEFFERRALVPLLAALIEPVAGENSLEVVSIVGVFAFALLLYALLRTRFDPLPSWIGVTACLAWPPLRWAFMPLTEGWGLALMTLSLLAAVLYMDRRAGRWLVVWAIAILLLGFTRDFTPVPVLGAVALVVFRRSPQSWKLAGTAVLASLPAPLLLGGALREQLAYGFSGRTIPDDASWGFVLGEYPGALEDAIRGAGEYLFQARPAFLEEAWPLWPFTLIVIAGLVVLLAARSSSRDDCFLPLLQGGVVGALISMALNPVFNHYRYQLVLLPMAGAGIAVFATAVVRRLPPASSARIAGGAPVREPPVPTPRRPAHPSDASISLRASP